MEEYSYNEDSSNINSTGYEEEFKPRNDSWLNTLNYVFDISIYYTIAVSFGLFFSVLIVIICILIGCYICIKLFLYCYPSSRRTQATQTTPPASIRRRNRVAPQLPALFQRELSMPPIEIPEVLMDPRNLQRISREVSRESTLPPEERLRIRPQEFLSFHLEEPQNIRAIENPEVPMGLRNLRRMSREVSREPSMPPVERMRVHPQEVLPFQQVEPQNIRTINVSEMHVQEVQSDQRGGTRRRTNVYKRTVKRSVQGGRTFTVQADVHSPPREHRYSTRSQVKKRYQTRSQSRREDPNSTI